MFLKPAAWLLSMRFQSPMIPKTDGMTVGGQELS